ncbi:MAG: aminomethyl-transferring glycine dehydrogenase subunit GcvPB [Cyanobacteria bacterium P01_H01_bin.74]
MKAPEKQLSSSAKNKAMASVLEPCIFEHSRPGVTTTFLFDTESSNEFNATDFERIIPQEFRRETPPRLPECAQLDVIRHFLRLSQLNHCIDKAFYPLGSCTMKYNPKLCDAVSALSGFSDLHPHTPDEDAQGALAVMAQLQQFLCDITGFDAVTLQPAAGAHGELLGMMMIKAYFQQAGQYQRTEVIVPDAAHGTNPATAVMCGFSVKEIRSKENGLIDLDQLDKALSEKTAALMLTNPSTAGLFERDILTVSERVHQAGGLMYYDGANLNAILGQVRPADMGFDVMHINTHKTFATPHGGGGPGCGPVAVGKKLEPFLPVPRILFNEATGLYYRQADGDALKHSVGKMKAFFGNFDMHVRAYTYLMAYGWLGLKQVSTDAVLNANYIKERLKESYAVAFDSLCKHEVVFNNSKQQAADKRLRTMAIVKRLMDYGFHPPTVYFPLIVPEALMIEPTETESKATLDGFIEAMLAIAEECQTDPELVLNAPYSTPVSKVDETLAARHPNLNFFSSPLP